MTDYRTIIARITFLSWWIALLLFSKCTNASFNFDRDDPGYPENFDPSLASPDGRITCPGPLPAGNYLGIPRNPGDPPIDPRTLTLQQLCAKPQYGGNPSIHLGGFCPQIIMQARDDAGRRLLPIVFDISNKARTSKPLSLPRLQAYCLQRCHCTIESDDEPPRRKAYRIAPRYPNDPDLSQANPDVDISLQDQEPWQRPVRQIPGLRLVYWQEHVDLRLGLNAGRKFLSLAPSNRIFCEPDKALPTFALPDGWRAMDFLNSQELCATALDGGHTAANAGGYCDTKSEPQPVVAFSQEFTPSLAFTISQGPWSTEAWKAYAIQSFCFAACRCRDPDPPPRVSRADDSGVLLVDEDVADILREVTINGKKSVRRFRLVPEPPPDQQCHSTSGTRTCVEMLPEYLFPPAKPITDIDPTLLAQVETVMKDKPKMPVCGDRCTTNGDCTGLGQPESCRCVVYPSVLQAKLAHADPVGTISLCLTLAVTSLSRQHRRPGWLGGRDIVEGEDEEQWWLRSDLACPCNTTYVSQSCCHESSGIVWEPGALTMGSLS